MKEPDLSIRPSGSPKPTLVVESGWSETHKKLLDDIRLWVKGGAGAVVMAIVIKWTKTNNSVKGFIEVYVLDQTGNEHLIQKEDIFPRPAPGAPVQQIAITRGQLFGAALLPGRNPNDTFNLSLNGLRAVATETMRIEGYQPA